MSTNPKPADQPASGLGMDRLAFAPMVSVLAD
jgi:hypothetical protein